MSEHRDPRYQEQLTLGMSMFSSKKDYEAAKLAQKENATIGGEVTDAEVKLAFPFAIGWNHSEEDLRRYRQAAEVILNNRAALALPVAQAQAEAAWVMAMIEGRRKRYELDQSCTPEFLHWVDTQARREGVGANEAWNAGYSCALAALEAKPVTAEGDVKDAEIAMLRTQLTGDNGALTRMDRARSWLTDDNPRSVCNWGVLDTEDIRAALARNLKLDGPSAVQSDHEIRHWAEEYECAMKCLNDAKVPTLDGTGAVYSLWRRIKAFAIAQPEQPVPPFGDKRKAAMAVYTPPFKYEHGYIFDSQHLMVADNGEINDAQSVEGAIAARVRGWGRLGYLPNGAELQDEIGQMMADALNSLYADIAQPAPRAAASDHRKLIQDSEETGGEYWKSYAEALADDFSELADFYTQLKATTPRPAERDANIAQPEQLTTLVAPAIPGIRGPRPFISQVVQPTPETKGSI